MMSKIKNKEAAREYQQDLQEVARKLKYLDESYQKLYYLSFKHDCPDSAAFRNMGLTETADLMDKAEAMYDEAFNKAHDEMQKLGIDPYNISPR